MKTLRVSVILALAFTLAILASCSEEGSLAPSGSVATGDEGLKSGPVPFHFQVYNTIEIVSPPPVIHAIFPGHGKSHPFGPFTMYATSDIDVTVYPFHQVTEYVFTYNNGDELYASSDGEGIEDPPGTTIFSGDITFTGGTGRFADATGDGTYEGSADVIAGLGQFTIDGTIEGFVGDDD